MSTDSLLATGSRPLLAARPPLRHLWQVPLFLTGLLVFVTVALAHPLWSNSPSRVVARSLADARSELDKSRPDLERVVRLTEHALAQTAPASRQAGEAQFLLGTAYLRSAEQAPAETAASLWQQAKDHLEQAEHIGIAEADRARLAYRLGKASAALDADPQRIIDCLNWSIGDAADDAFEGYGLLAQAYLRLPVPDLRGALEATRKQLALQIADDASLAAPRLLCGELLRRLDQPEEARKVLARIGPGAPPDILFKARYLRARLLQEDGNWAEAASLWEAVKSDPRWVTVEPAHVLYSLGLCYRKLERLKDAIGTWEATRLRGGEEGQAAALGLAELRLKSDQPAAVLEVFESALRGVSTPADYHNALVDLAEVRGLCEASIQQFRQAGNFQEAVQLANLYEKIAAPGAGQELAGESAEDWANYLRALAQRASDTDATKRLEEEARQRFRQAGVAFEAAAAQTAASADQAERLWRSVTDSLQGRDHAHVVQVLERYVRSPVPPERQGQAWFVLGEAHRIQGNPLAARNAFQKCIEYPGPYPFRARYELAVAKIEQKQYEDAEEDLVHNLKMMAQLGPDPEAHEKSLITLASLLYQRRNYNEALRRLQEALDRYPANANAVKLRLQLALCCRELAAQAGELASINPGSTTDAERSYHRKRQRDLLEMAGVNYQKLVDDLESAQLQQALTAEQEAILGQVRFAVADCRYDLGKYPEALYLYNVLAKRYENTVEGLIALKHACRCHFAMSQLDKARAVVEQIKAALPRTTFDGTADNRTRAWWENWLADQGKLRDLPRGPAGSR
jgi:tetratricopeptide (TPR) repeat protein